MLRGLRVVAQVGLGLVALVAAAALAAVLFVRTAPGREWLRGRLMRELPGVHIGRLDGNPLRHLLLWDVRSRVPGVRAQVAIERLEVELDLTGLVRRTLRIPHVNARGVAVEPAPAPAVEPAEGGGGHGGDGSGGGWRVVVENVE